MLKKPVWNTIETTLFYYSDNIATAHVWSGNTSIYVFIAEIIWQTFDVIIDDP